MELTIEQALQQGLAAHNAGNLQEAERAYQAILQSQPKHPDANHNLGLIAISVNQIEAALPLFKTALNVNPNIEQFWVSYIDALVKAKHLKDAKQAIKKAKKKGFDATKLQALFSQSKVNVDTKVPSQQQLSSLLECYQTGQYGDAEKLAKSIAQQFPQHQFAWKVLGAIFGQSGRTVEAENANQTSVALSPQDAEAHSNLGNTLQELGRLDEAETSYMQAIALKPGYAKAHSNLGNTLKELGRLDKAEASYKQAIALKPDFAEPHSNLGNTLQELGKLDEAEASYTQAIALKPNFAEAHYNLGITLQELGKLDEAEASCRQAIALKPDYAEAHYNLGNTLKELGRLDEAEASYTQAIAFKPNYVEAHNNLGNALKELGRLDEAETSYMQAIALKPDYAKAHSNLGNTLKELERLDKAEASYKQAIALKPDYAEAHGNLGNTLKELGRLDEAETSYKQALALKPDLALAHFGLGIVLYIKGNEDLALKSIVKANHIEPQSKDYELLLSVMEVRKSRKGNEAAVSDTSNITALTGLVSSPLILNREVEPELITSLYEMNFIQLDKTKRVGLLASGKTDARYGNGIVSPDFNLFKEARSIIQKLAEDLTKIMMKALKSDIYIYDSFFNILSAGGGTFPHAHLSNLDRIIGLNIGKQKYSLVYYLSVGDQNCREPGILKLYEPSEDILPCEGMITIIPASRMHSAVYGGKTDRVMVGVNFYIL
jgi:tetratricopeptide (TPR) repeat protein